MMSQGYIDEIVRDATREAEEEGLEPLYMSPGMLKAMRAGGEIYPLPFLGDHVPTGWERTERDEYFCDSTGMGHPGERALTMEQMFEAMEPGYGYAVTEHGQFQCYVAQYQEI